MSVLRTVKTGLHGLVYSLILSFPQILRVPLSACDCSDFGVRSSSFLSLFLGRSDASSGGGCFTDVVSRDWLCSTFGLITCSGPVIFEELGPEPSQSGG